MAELGLAGRVHAHDIQTLGNKETQILGNDRYKY